MKSLKMLVFLLLVISISACGGGGGGGSSTAGVPNPVTPGNPIIPVVPSASDSEGSVQSPVLVAIDSPRSSKVAGATLITAPSYYKFTTGAAGTYIIGLTNTHQYLSWDLYSDASFTTYITGCDNYFLTGDEVGMVDLQASTTYYLKVSNMALAADTYTLTVSYLHSEGTTVAPVDLTVGVAHSGSIAANGKSYYRFMTTKAGAFTVSYSNKKSYGGYQIGTNIYQNSDFTGLITSTNPYYSADCTANGLQPNTYYYVEVSQNVNSGLLYDIKVTEGISEGSLTSPVQLSLGVSRNSGVDGAGTSYYTFTTTAAGAYILSISPTSAVAVSIYSTADFSTGSVANLSMYPGATATISGLDVTKQYYLKITNQTSVDAIYSVSVSGGSTEGSVASPVKLTVNQLHSATVDSYGTAYYYFTTLTSGTHTINLSTSQNADWILYSDSAYTTSFNIPGTYYANCSTSSSAAGNCTTINLDAGANYYLKVTNSSSTSAGCSITVSDGTGSEGSVASPVVLSDGVTHAGRIAGTVSYPYGTSYYKFTAGSSRPYLIMVTDVLSGGQYDIGWYMFGPAGLSSPAIGPVSINATFAGDAIAATSEFNPAVTLVAGTDYYLRVYNMNASNNGYNIKVFPYDVAAGCNAGGNCIDFELGIPVSPVFDLNPQLPYQNTAALPWAVDATKPATGTKSFKAGSTAPAGSTKFPIYQSCFEFQATGVKWLDFSLATQSSSSQDSLVFYLDGYINYGSPATNQWPGTTPWLRQPIRIGTSGTHTYEWCFYKNDNASNTGTAWIDDISLHY